MKNIKWSDILIAAIFFVLDVIALNLVARSGYPIAGYVFFGATMILFFGSGFGTNSGDPKTIALVTFLGEYTRRILDVGYWFLPFNGILYGTISLEAKQQNIDLEPVTFMTPDKVTGSVPVSYSYVLDTSSEEGPGGEIPVVTFIGVGKHSGVQDIIQDRIRSAIRAFMPSPERGAQTWFETQLLNEAAIHALLENIVRDEGGLSVPSSVNAETLFKHFGLSSEFFSDFERSKYGDDPKVGIADAILADADRAEYRDLADEAGVPYEEHLRTVVRNLHTEILNLRGGQARYRLKSLGIILVRLSLEEMAFDPKVVAAASKQAIEKLQRVAERENTVARLEQLRMLKRAGLTPDKAVEVMQIEAETVTKHITEHQLTVAGSAEDKLGAFAPAALAWLASKVGGGGKDSSPRRGTGARKSKGGTP